MKSLHLLSVVPVLLSLVACADTEGADAPEGESEVTSANDLLAVCPALEGFSVSASVVGDASTFIKQSYVVSDANGQNGTTITNAVVPSTNYDVRFYRDGSGKAKFQLTIGAYAGMQSSIDGAAKRLTASGSVAFAKGSKDYGELTLTSRRDALEGVAGALSKLKFSALDCTTEFPSVTVYVPVISLDKTSNDLVDVVDTQGHTIRVTPKVKFQKKLDSAPLRFVMAAG